MADNPLGIISGGNSGTQAGTQSPQTAGQGVAGGTPTSKVQTGTASQLLDSSNGVSLGGGNQVTAIDLNNVQTQQAQVTSEPDTPREISPGMIAVPVVLVALAIVVAFFVNRSVKNTTY